MIDNEVIDNLEIANESNDTIELDNNDADNISNDSTSEQSSLGSDSTSEAISNNDNSINTEQPGSKENSNEYLNFKALRQAKKQAERERDELAKKIEELSKSNSNQVSADDDIYEDDVAQTRREIKDLKNQWIAQQNQVKTKTIEEKLKSEFPDLETVVNEDNIEVLKARDPNFARIINRAPNDPDELYHRAVAAYTLIKKYGIYIKDNHEKDRARVEKNMAKPRPASAAAAKSSEGLSDFAEFANLNSEERNRAIMRLAKERANS